MPASKYLRFDTWEVCVRIPVVTIFLFSVAAIPVLASGKKFTDAELDASRVR
jgi:hypothetical protein